MIDSLVNFLSFVFVFGIIVFVHELGHFVMAKKAGARVDEFGFGFGPKLLKFKKGETTYSVNLFPLGGFVKIFGESEGEEEETKKPDERSFNSKTPWQKTQILVAGVIMNLLLAFVILTVALAVGIQPLMPNTQNLPGVVSDQRVIIADISKDSPAKNAGIEAISQIVAINGEPVISSFEVITKVNEIKENPIVFKLKKDENSYEKTVTPKKEGDFYLVGIVLKDEGKIKSPLVWAPVGALFMSYDMIKATIQGFFGFLGQLFFDFKVSENVTGPVGIYKMTGAVSQLGFSFLMQFIAIISLTLGVINILPFPGLDGGHLMFLIMEAVSGKKISQKIKNSFALAGIALLILLMAIVTWKDLLRFDIL